MMLFAFLMERQKYLVYPARPVKFFEEKERSGFNRGKSCLNINALSPHFPLFHHPQIPS